MNGFSPSGITANPQFADLVIQQPDQTDLTYPPNQVDGLSASPWLVVCLCVAAIFFCIGVGVGRRHTRHHKLIAIRLRQIQTLERIWQMTAKRRD
ncbi:MAG: hypothetical protein HWQ41_09095 [Nostoc sp. NOS(2021)]|uniref:hypothetical protein n=1 Tax=Nostoc sp. NOS(2021) TaxID=2815407 RepID=UPI0025D878DC|nr:hypothetical protein [Nostoc sp. NOS(2021)]MBN3895404.1 hypothetical protein [Nostoc sp. NOS(2021)]